MNNSLLKLYKAGGIQRIYQEIGNFIFDLYNNVETRKRVNNDSYDEIFDYMPSYKKSVSNPLKFIQNSEVKLEEYSFIDIGCGKGKVLLIASKYNFKNLIGYEINEKIFSILNKNINSLQIKNLMIINESIDVEKIQNKSIVYFYNPFSENMTNSFFEKLSTNKNLKNLIIIYVNPQYVNILNKYSWKKVYQKKVSTQKLNIWIKHEQ